MAQQRMDNARPASIDISLNKAYTAVALQLPTHELAPLAQPQQPLFGIHNAGWWPYRNLRGGISIESGRGDRWRETIGVSGGSVETGYGLRSCRNEAHETNVSNLIVGFGFGTHLLIACGGRLLPPVMMQNPIAVFTGLYELTPGLIRKVPFYCSSLALSRRFL